MIKAFREIPMADLEVVFPEKRISMKPLDLLKLSITGFIGLGVVLAKVLAASALNPYLALAALSTMGGYATKVLLGLKNSRDRYRHLVTYSLYNKNLNNDLGVVFYLIDALEEQEVKEALLGYHFLHTEGPMTKQQLDRRCEEFLCEQFDSQVDFEIEDSLHKLVTEGLVQRDGDSYLARPINEALETLDRKWDEYFRFSVA